MAAALAREGAPLLVTTADHALLESAWVDEFTAATIADPQADAFVGLARSEAVLAAAPGTVRTWLRFSDGAYSGCNLFLLRTPASLGIVRFWQELEAERKRPLSLLRRLGPGYVLRYRFGWLGLGQALAQLGRLAGARLAPVVLCDGRAAIDVDKPADLILVRELVALPRRGAAGSAGGFSADSMSRPFRKRLRDQAHAFATFWRRSVIHQGVRLSLRGASVRVRYRLGRDYELDDVRLLRVLLRPGDRVLELGSAVGFLAVYCMKQLGIRDYAAVEANPRAQADHGRELQAHGIALPSYINAAAGPAAGTVRFNVCRDYVASSVGAVTELR